MFNLKIIIGNRSFETKQDKTSAEYQAEAEINNKEVKKDYCSVRFQEKNQSKK